MLMCALHANQAHSVMVFLLALLVQQESVEHHVHCVTQPLLLVHNANLEMVSTSSSALLVLRISGTAMEQVLVSHARLERVE